MRHKVKPLVSAKTRLAQEMGKSCQIMRLSLCAFYSDVDKQTQIIGRHAMVCPA